jgi:hypothetical protein
VDVRALRRAAPLALLLLSLAATCAPSAATAASAISAPAPGNRISEDEARAAALRDPVVAKVRREHPGSTISAQLKDGRWVVDVNAKALPGEQIHGLAQAYVDPSTGLVTEKWTGPYVAWTMARGYPGAFGRSVNSPWIWVTLCVLFVLPFVDVRRPLRWLHADLLALVGFSASIAFFNDARLDLSVPLAYPLLAYLLVRLLWIGLRRAPGAAPPLRLNIPWRWLGVATLFLIGFRIGLNAADGNVIDVGYSGVIGADKLVHGRDLWGAFPTDNEHGDTYGPLLYLAYVPFELVFPWHGSWDELPAAHAAAGFFDLACVVLLFLIGRRLAGAPLGVALAYGWVTYPFTIYATNAGVNDALPATLVLAALLVHARPMARGALVAAAGLTKFSALPLLGLWAFHGLGPPGRRWRRLLLFAAGAGLVIAAGAAIVLAYSDPSKFWDRTIAFQADREAPFSVWGYYGGAWETVQRVVQAGAVILAVAVAFVPRRDDVVGLAALSGALLVAFQLATTYWFYMYIVWVAPLALIAFLARLPAPELSPARAPAAAPARSSQPAVAPSTG